MMKGVKFLLMVMAALMSIFSCTSEHILQIVIAENPTKTELFTAEDLKEDLEKVLTAPVAIVPETKASKNATQFLLGTASSNTLLREALSESGVKLTEQLPGSRGGLWYKLDEQTIILAGSDVQGMQYAVYDYSKEILSLDPLLYWTGHSIPSREVEDLFDFENRTIAPPKVPWLVYFENDVDELMNLHEPLLDYDWESYTEMINALVRMRYNGIQMFDLLGRAEFFLRPEYQELVPGYDVDIDKIERMIDYAQDMGMAVQVDLSLGYKIRALESEYADCWKLHKEKWIEVWKYYLEETPIGKADIFSLRPRNQVWDWEYKSTCGEDKIEVFNNVYQVLDSVLEAHNPTATKVVICYHDGMDMWNDGFRPPEDWIIAWSDDGYAGFKVLPETTGGYAFGTYMHGGFWKNHTVSHPYPRTIDKIMHKMFNNFNATAYCQVNGQQFRPFLVNLEAFSEVSRDPDQFTGDSFLKSWASRYFPDNLRSDIVDLIDEWDEASFGKAGYVQNLWEVKEVIAYLAEIPIMSPGKGPKPFTAERVQGDRVSAMKRLEMFQYLYERSTGILPSTDENSAFYYDQIHYPIEAYHDLLNFEVLLHEMFSIKRTYEEKPQENLKNQARLKLKEAKIQLDNIYEKTRIPAKDPKWNSWYDVKNRRPNNGFPTPEMLAEIENAIDTKW